MKGIYHCNELFQLVRNNRLTNYQFASHWLKNKRDDFAFGEKKEAAYVSSDGFAQWTLCDRESDGTNDVMNIKKIEDIKSIFYKNMLQMIILVVKQIIQPKVENQEAQIINLA